MAPTYNEKIYELWADKLRFMYMLKGGAIFCVYNQAQAKICERVGAKAIISVGGGHIYDNDDEASEAFRMADPGITKDIMDSVALPVFGRVRVGHEMEAKITQHLYANGIHEYDIITTAANEGNHILKKPYKVPFICAASDLGEALWRISEGASMIHTKGGDIESSPNIANAIIEVNTINSQIKAAVSKFKNKDDLKAYAEEIDAPYTLLEQVARRGKLPVPLFGHGGIFEPTDAAYLMSQNCDGLIISANALSSMDVQRRALALVVATENPKNYEMLAKISENMDVPPID
ncbi:Pyridoxal 5'-phosphate synthase subunit snz1 [Coemansia sp. RSA 1813]|nr:Pyridoxal 5'-phosphate synthase subunit snz1 [Coemansia sp. RSA 1646]KAJ1772257.1 Pyridoxal 5'-phosphate synthase subunit snz1 [Coemansia sp. RSA 1843]KAJ2091889.1 Pyridoxal 5'-phosphate synthase subunit snz1 [Coemansia sp. RSA 986]KAJ2215785.1 Pyridoxal 5'-phosphate synthase subunit snz1 [Coemansia sp. RSA 487]KAJ2571716.1 Pyridoxal 5'-phosphate synthase subunit snz1 [Coemansia sp. RSA 1813]